ncbi:MAG: hypothetical protein ACQEQ4_10445 [Fibrobacterota bacterium]
MENLKSIIKNSTMMLVSAVILLTAFTTQAGMYSSQSRMGVSDYKLDKVEADFLPPLYGEIS